MVPVTSERSTASAGQPTEVVVRVDGGRRRRPSLLGLLALAGVALLVFMGVGFANGWLGLDHVFSTRTTDRSAPVILHKLNNISSYRAASATLSVTVDEEKDVSILPQFLAGPLRRPAGFDGVGVAQVQQRPVGHAADVGPAGGAERRQGLVPGGPDVRVGGGFGADRVGGVGVAG